jgi:hypothetical protein
MTIAVTNQAGRAALAASLALCTLSIAGIAHADETQGEPTFKATASSAPAATDTSNQLLGPIERLPASAYPSDPVVGIPFGSLEISSGRHGLQFPYYPKTGIGVSGYAWVDTGYEHVAHGLPTDHNQKLFVQEGRAVLRISPTWSDGRWFAQAQGEFVANEDQSQSQPISTDVDDMWVKAGLWKIFDIQAGRFQGWEIYHYGLGLDINTLEREGAVENGTNPVPIYGVSYLWDYAPSLGAVAAHFYPFKFLRFELAGRYGDGNQGTNEYGVRPVGIVDLGFLKFKAGVEYSDATPQDQTIKSETKQQGIGGSIQGVFYPYLEGGVNAAYGQQRTITTGNPDGANSFDTYSLGVFANAKIIDTLMVGGGLNYTYLANEQYDGHLQRDVNFDQWQIFGAIQYVLWKRLLIKNVVGYALANFNPTQVPTFQNIMVSERLRLEYFF